MRGCFLQISNRKPPRQICVVFLRAAAGTSKKTSEKHWCSNQFTCVALISLSICGTARDAVGSLSIRDG